MVAMATILALEDDPVSQRLLRLIIEKEGHTTLFAENGAEAWELLKTTLLPNLIIIDNQLRGEKGIEFLHNFRANPLYENTPIIICITAPNRSTVMQFAGAKVQTILAKPYSPEKIIGELNKALMTDPYVDLFEDEASFCARMGMTSEAYHDMMGVTSVELGDSIREVITALEHKHWQALRGSLSRLISLGTSLGFNALARFCQKLSLALQSPESASALFKEAPRTLDLISKVFQDRMGVTERNTTPITDNQTAAAS